MEVLLELYGDFSSIGSVCCRLSRPLQKLRLLRPQLAVNVGVFNQQPIWFTERTRSLGCYASSQILQKCSFIHDRSVKGWPKSQSSPLTRKGWLSVIAWQALAASTGYLISTWLQGIIILSYPNFVPKPWRTMLIIWAVMLFAVVMNCTTSRVLARFEGLILVLHLGGFFCVLIPLIYLGPHDTTSARAVFTTFMNEGGWSTQTLSFLVGLPASVFSLMGADCVVHVSAPSLSKGCPYYKRKSMNYRIKILNLS
jgi:hypothetical protein